MPGKVNERILMQSFSRCMAMPNTMAFLVVLVTCTHAARWTCDWSPPGYKLEFNLNKFVEITGPDAVQNATIEGPEGGHVYFNLCHNVPSPSECHNRVPEAPGFKTIKGDTPLGGFSPDPTLCFPLGELDHQTWSLLDPSDPHKGFRLKYSASNPYKSLAVSVHCAKGGGTSDAVAVACTLKPKRSETCELMINSVMGCPTKAALSIGDITLTEEEKNAALQVFGVSLAIMGNLLISVSLNVQKYVHNQVQASGGSFMADKRWWFGLALMIIGEVGNFLAYGMAPAAVVSPLGAVSVVSNAIIATKFLGEPFTTNTFIGVVMAIAGGVLFVSFAPVPPPDKARMTTKELELMAIDPYFLSFVAFVLLVVGAVYYASKAKGGMYSSRYVFVYLLLCSTLGSITVLCIKALSQLLQLTLSGNQQFLGKGYLPYSLIIITGVTGFLQIRYLQMAMETFGNSEVVPVYYVLFTACTVIAGAVAFKEFNPDNIGAWEISFFLLGMLCTFIGVFFITSKRPIKLTDSSQPWRERIAQTWANILQDQPRIRVAVDGLRKTIPGARSPPQWSERLDDSVHPSSRGSLSREGQSARNITVLSPSTYLTRDVELDGMDIHQQAMMSGAAIGGISTVLVDRWLNREDIDPKPNRDRESRRASRRSLPDGGDDSDASPQESPQRATDAALETEGPQECE